MGIIPKNQHLLGLEGAGVIRRVGRSASQFTVGQRVFVFEKGTFGNRIIATTERTYRISDDMTFEIRLFRKIELGAVLIHLQKASMLPSVYLTAIIVFSILSILKKTT